MPESSLTPERWRQFSFGRQIRLIAEELQRATKLTTLDDRKRRRNSFERVFELADLTIAGERSPGRLRELQRWREILGDSYLAPNPDAAADRALLRALLRMNPQNAPRVV